MSKIKLTSYKLVILGLNWALISFTIYPLQVRSQSAQFISNSEAKRLSFPPPTSQNEDDNGEGRPTHRTSGGSRGSCSEPLVALVPGKGKIALQQDTCSAKSESFVALTLAESPTFWFYIRQSPTTGLKAEFVLLDENGQAVDEQVFPLSGTPGIVSIHLTKTLETNKKYRWVFSILNNPQRPSKNPTVEGLVKRVVPDSTLIGQLEQATSPQERIAIYVRYGIWHDALTSIAELRRKTPEDSSLTADWSDLLDSVGLGAIAPTPLVDCCTTEK